MRFLDDQRQHQQQQRECRRIMAGRKKVKQKKIVKTAAKKFKKKIKVEIKGFCSSVKWDIFLRKRVVTDLLKSKSSV